MRKLLLLVEEFEALKLRDRSRAPHFILHDIVIIVNKPNCPVLEEWVIPWPISIEIEEILDYQLSEM